MTNLKLITTCLCLGFMLSCTSTSDEVATADSTSVDESKNTTQTSMDNLPMEKSIHLFDMPEGVTEAEWSQAIRDVNDVIAKAGYPHAGYAFYKVSDDSVKTNRYYFEGVWPGGDDYQKIHDNPDVKAAQDKLKPIYDKIRAVEIYRKVKLVQ